MTTDDNVIGVYTDLTGEWPQSRYVFASEVAAPTLTDALIDEVCDTVDTSHIWHEAVAWTAAGEDLQLAERTLAHIRSTLHARTHEILDRASETGASPGGSQVP